MSTVTMQELELETAELLPARETLTAAPAAIRARANFNLFGGNNVNQDGGRRQHQRDRQHPRRQRQQRRHRPVAPCPGSHGGLPCSTRGGCTAG